MKKSGIKRFAKKIKTIAWWFMAISNDELRTLFENFQWIDDIPEDQEKRDEICLEGKLHC